MSIKIRLHFVAQDRSKEAAAAARTDVRTRNRNTVARKAVSANSRAINNCGVGVLDLSARRNKKKQNKTTNSRKNT